MLVKDLISFLRESQNYHFPMQAATTLYYAQQLQLFNEDKGHWNNFYDAVSFRMVESGLRNPQSVRIELYKHLNIHKEATISQPVNSVFIQIAEHLLSLSNSEFDAWVESVSAKLASMENSVRLEMQQRGRKRGWDEDGEGGAAQRQRIN